MKPRQRLSSSDITLLVILASSLIVLILSLALIFIDGSSNWFTPAGAACTATAMVITFVSSRRQQRKGPPTE